jgi:hypothetical protein
MLSSVEYRERGKEKGRAGRETEAWSGRLDSGLTGPTLHRASVSSVSRWSIEAESPGSRRPRSAASTPVPASSVGAQTPTAVPADRAADRFRGMTGAPGEGRGKITAQVQQEDCGPVLWLQQQVAAREAELEQVRQDMETRLALSDSYLARLQVLRGLH